MPLGLYRYEESEVWNVRLRTVIAWFALLLVVTPLIWLTEQRRRFFSRAPLPPAGQ
ncbi:MAG: hypothetical protein Q8R35_02935 [bacterium]|nr:hypothetical protein [bacterium]